MRATKDFTTAAWRKLCFNCAGAVSAVALASDVVARFESAADLAELLVMECAQWDAQRAPILSLILRSTLSMY